MFRGVRAPFEGHMSFFVQGRKNEIAAANIKRPI